MNDEISKRIKEDNKKIEDLLTPYLEDEELGEAQMYHEILDRISPYITRPKDISLFQFHLIRDDAPEEIRLLHKFLTQVADRENWAGFEDDDYIVNPETDSYFKDGKFLGFKYSKTYKPEMIEQGEIFTKLINNPSKILA